MKNPYYVALGSIVGFIAFAGFYLSLSRLNVIADALILLSDTKNTINQTPGNLSPWNTPIDVPILNQIPFLNTIPGFIMDIAFSIIMLLIFIRALIFSIENVR